MGVPRQEYWSRLPFPFLGDLNPGIETASPTLDFFLLLIHQQSQSTPQKRVNDFKDILIEISKTKMHRKMEKTEHNIQEL